jgi:hypothetical protein
MVFVMTGERRYASISVRYRFNDEMFSSAEPQDRLGNVDLVNEELENSTDLENSR